MNGSESKNNELITSRITVSFFVFSLLSLLSWVYILPFKKHYLVINDYYKYIELVVIIITCVIAISVFCYNVYCNKKKLDFKQKLITPRMLAMYSFPTFLSSVIIPLSNNRTLTYKYCIALFLTVFLAYATWYLVSKQFAYLSFITFIFCGLFAFSEYMYSFDVTFSDKIQLSYPSFIAIFISIILLLLLCGFLLSRKTVKFKFEYVIVLSFAALFMIILRIFVLRYVSLIAILLQILIYISLIVIEKKGIKFKK